MWPHGEFPLIEVGVFELNRNPQNYFAEVEQAAFKPSALVPGIGPSPDKMLQARLMSYGDAHLHRIGPNWHQLPVNQARCQVTNYSRDAALANAAGYGSAPNYWPNSLAGTPEPAEQYLDPAWKLGEVVADRYDSPAGHDDYTQPGNLYRLFDEAQRERLATRIAGALGQARPEVQKRQVGHFLKADGDYGRRVAAKLGIELETKAAAG